MNKLKCITIDDEPLALIVLSEYIEKTHFLQLVDSFTSPLEALQYIKSNAVDIVFIDIQMPELSGLVAAELFPSSVNIIFTTAYKEFASEGYNLNATDYLLKPFSFERFLKAVLKVENNISKSKTLEAQNTGTHQQIRPAAEHKTFYVKTDKKIVSLSTKDLFYVQGLKDYVILMTSSGKLIARESIKNLEELLGNEQFMRVHKSYIVGFEHIDYIEGNEIFLSGKSVPLGSSYKIPFLERLNNRMIGKR